MRTKNVIVDATFVCISIVWIVEFFMWSFYPLFMLDAWTFAPLNDKDLASWADHRVVGIVGVVGSLQSSMKVSLAVLSLYCVISGNKGQGFTLRRIVLAGVALVPSLNFCAMFIRHAQYTWRNELMVPSTFSVLLWTIWIMYYRDAEDAEGEEEKEEEDKDSKMPLIVSLIIFALLGFSCVFYAEFMIKILYPLHISSEIEQHALEMMFSCLGTHALSHCAILAGCLLTMKSKSTSRSRSHILYYALNNAILLMCVFGLLVPCRRMGIDWGLLAALPLLSLFVPLVAVWFTFAGFL